MKLTSILFFAFVTVALASPVKSEPRILASSLKAKDHIDFPIERVFDKSWEDRLSTREDVGEVKSKVLSVITRMSQELNQDLAELIQMAGEQPNLVARADAASVLSEIAAWVPILKRLLKNILVAISEILTLLDYKTTAKLLDSISGFL